MTTLSMRGRAALLTAALASATAAPGCSLFDRCRDGCGSGTSKTEYKTATIPAPPGGQTALPTATTDYQPQPGITPAMR